MDIVAQRRRRNGKLTIQIDCARRVVATVQQNDTGGRHLGGELVELSTVSMVPHAHDLVCHWVNFALFDVCAILLSVYMLSLHT